MWTPPIAKLSIDPHERAIKGPLKGLLNGFSMNFNQFLLDGFGFFGALDWGFRAPGARKSDPRGPTSI